MVPGVSTGSRKLDQVIGLSSGRPLLAALYGPSGSGKSQVVYTAGVVCAASMLKKFSLVLTTFMTSPPVERLYEIAYERGYDPGRVLDRIIVVNVRSRRDLDSFMRFVKESAGAGGLKLVLMDDVPEVLVWAGSPAELSYLLLRLSSLVNVYDVSALLTYPVRFDVERGVEKPAGYEYSWPFVDRFVRLTKVKEGVFTARSNLGDAIFRVTRKGVEDAL